MLLLGLFVFDASSTLVRRWRGGKRWYEAHREHAYQRAVLSGHSHRRVTSAAAALTGILTVIALFAWLQPQLLLVACAAGVILLTAVYIWIEHMRPMERATRSARVTTPL
jgi:Fuc2NAc and GlcNAc transferase